MTASKAKPDTTDEAVTSLADPVQPPVDAPVVDVPGYDADPPQPPPVD